jgi:hypothetical protein
MRTLDSFKAEAIRRGLLEPKAILDPALVFSLVRDMPLESDLPHDRSTYP